MTFTTNNLEGVFTTSISSALVDYIENWKNPNLSPKSGVLAKYKKTVQSASNGAITD